MASCKIQESKKKARRSVNCMFKERMMICGIEFVDQAAKFEKGANELSFWWSSHASEELE